MFYCLAGVLSGWIVARIDLPRRTVGIVLFVPLLGLSLLVPLFASPRGFYTRDIVMIVAIAVSPLIGGRRYREPDEPRTPECDIDYAKSHQR